MQTGEFNGCLLSGRQAGKQMQADRQTGQVQNTPRNKASPK